MKRITSRVIFVLTALCILLQAQPVYAEQIISSAETEHEQGIEQSGASEETPEDTEKPEQPELPENPTEPGQPESPEESTEPEQPDNPQEEKPQKPIPGAVSGLCTTCQSDTKVLIEWDKSEGADKYKIYRKQAGSEYKLIKTTRNNYYTDTKIQYGKKYCYKIIPLNEDRKAGKSATISLNNRQAVNITSQKYNYAQMKTDMKELKAQYNNYCEMEEIGKTVEGRSIYDFSVGNPKAKKSLLVVSTLHGREYICSAVLMKEIQYYLRNYNHSIDGLIPANVFKNMQIHYVVMANPDGVTISQTKFSRWKANGRGVDLNRNFPAKIFKVGGKRGAEGYSGSKPLTEPESKTVVNLTQKLKKHQNLCGVVNYHAMGNIIYGDCSSSKLSKDTKTMYRIAQAQTGYKKAVDSGIQVPGGQYREYVMYMLHIPSITLEIGKTSAPCAYWQYESEFQKNKKIVLKIARAL